ncbi:replication initiation protein [Clostridium sp.]|uniref:replication initiation protein n=1 Tax=Clostridium sp. TaxID=1506 RepID=UPI00260E6710|nr:replication initiation protein [Clostridium sp.]
MKSVVKKVKPIITKKEIIKSNSLIESSYKFTISENRLIDLALTQLEVIMLDKDLSAEDVKKLIKQREFDEIEVNVIDYKKEYEIKNNSLYEDLAQTAHRLMDRRIFYFENKDLIEKQWVITCIYKSEKCAIALQFHPDLIPDLMVFKGCYTRFDFDIKKYIKSYYTCRIYELLKQYEKFGIRIFHIEQLRFLLGIEDEEYPAYANFKQRIIKPALAEINKVTDLYCEFEEIKNKRKVERIKFKFVKQSVNFDKKEQISFFEEKETNYISTIDEEYNVVKEFRDLLGITISPRQVDKLVDLATKSIKKYNLVIPIKKYIQQKKIVVDEYGKRNNIESYMGTLITAIKENWTLAKKEKNIKNTFNDYDQREYDYDDLENKLLGYNNVINAEYEELPH